MATTKERQRSGVVTVGCACIGGTSSLRCGRALAAALHHSRDVGARDVQRSTEPEDCQGGGHEQRSAEPDVECDWGHRVLLAVRGRTRENEA